MYLYSRGDYISLQIEVNNLDWNSLLDSNDIEENGLTFKNAYTGLVNKHIPHKLLSPGKRYSVPWLGDRCLKKAKTNRRKAKVRSNNSGLHVDKLLYKQACECYESASFKAKSSYELRLAKKIPENPKRFYNYAKTFTKSSSCSIDCLVKNGKKYSDDAVMSDILNEHFVSVMNCNTSKPPTFDYQCPDDVLSSIDFTELDIENLLIKVKPFKAISPDEVHPHVLHEAKPLYILFKQSLETGKLPSDWTDANICAIHKKGPRSSPNNYRPVLLTSHVVKVLERLILHDLLDHCTNNNIISCNQHGFQVGKSCLSNLLECFDDWTQTFDKVRPLQGTDIIYTDFQKAFDSVQHDRLLYKLSKYVIRGPLLKWLGGFLKLRRQRVVLNGSPSTWKSVISGVSQGTCRNPNGP